MLSSHQTTFVNALCRQYQEYIKTKNFISNTPDKHNDELEAYKSAAIHLAKIMDVNSISTLSPKQLMNLINDLHQIAAKPIYKNKNSYNSNPGQYRKDMCFIMRHPLSKANYTSPGEYGKIFITIQNDLRYGSNIAFDYLIGYYKLFTIPSNNTEAIEKFSNQLNAFAKQRKITLTKSELAGDLTAKQKFAVNIVYKVFIPYQDIPNAMQKFVEDLSRAMNSKEQDVYGVFATYYLKFIDIHPYQDCQGRVMTMLLNAFLWSKNISPIMLIDPNARSISDYKYGPLDPDVIKLKNYLTTLGKVHAFTDITQQSCSYYIYHSLHSRQYNNEGKKLTISKEVSVNLSTEDFESQIADMFEHNEKLPLLPSEINDITFDEIPNDISQRSFIPKRIC